MINSHSLALDISTFLCSIPEGESIPRQVAQNLVKAKLVVIFGTKTYGKETGSSYSTYQELQYVMEEKKPFLVILDVNLPGRNGLEVLKEIKSMNPEMPVVMVSGHHNPAQAATACKMGACDYITKPIDWKYLRNIAYLYSFVEENARS